MGSGSALVAAVRTGRRGAGYDTDQEYVRVARLRVEQELARSDLRPRGARPPVHSDGPEALPSTAPHEGKAALAIAEGVLGDAGFRVVQRRSKLRGLGVEVGFVARAADDVPWYFDVSGGFTAADAGLLRADTMWKALGRAHVLAANKVGPMVFLTSHLPRRPSAGDTALRAAGLLAAEGRERLSRYSQGGHHEVPLSGFWSDQDVAGMAAWPPTPASP